MIYSQYKVNKTLILEDIDILLNKINSVFQSTVEKTFPAKQKVK